MTNYIKEHIKDYLPAEYADAEVRVETITKANGVERTGFFVHKNDGGVSPVVYLDKYEEAYESGAPIEEITKNIAKTILNNQCPFPIDMENVTDYEKAKHFLKTSLCDPEINEAFLEDKPYMRCGAFAVVYELNVYEDADVVGAVKVTNGLLEFWGVDLDQLHKDAAEAMASTAQMFSMDDMLGAVFSDKEPCNLLEAEAEAKYPMYVLTNKSRVDGASVIALDGVLQRAGDVMGSNFYVLPSSRHELILVPDSKGDSWDVYKKMVSEVNSTQVPEEDLLSDKVQYYERAKMLLQQEPA